MKVSKLVATGLIGSMLMFTACANDSGPKETGGAVIGGIGGALLGSLFGKGSGQMAAIAVGTLAGAMIGQNVGKSLDRADRAAIDRAENQATTADMGETITWNNPDSGNHGTITPVRDGSDKKGRYCREFRQTIEIGGKLEEGYGTACRQADGSWQIMN
jgi:surface antigen